MNHILITNPLFSHDHLHRQLKNNRQNISNESEQLWRNALVRDFCFPKTCVSYYPSLKISNKALEYYVTSRHRNDLDDDIESDPNIEATTNTTTHNSSNNDNMNIDSDSSALQSVKSIFGHSASSAIYEAKSAFESWKQWKLVSKIYYKTRPTKVRRRWAQEQEMDNIDAWMDMSAIGNNVHGPCELQI